MYGVGEKNSKDFENICHPEAKPKALKRFFADAQNDVKCHCEGATHVGMCDSFGRTYACHCEERSDVAIAMSINNYEILKRVQDDKLMSEAYINALKDYKKKAAFTLAEVLITLGIIGVVAAMTIPTLISNYQEKQTVSQLTKVYATLTSAYQMMQAEYGPITTWGMKNTNTGEVDEEGNPIYDFSAQNLIAERLKKYLKVAKVCEVGKVCHPGAWYTLDGVKRSEANKVAENTSDNSVESRFFLQDGTHIQFGWFSGSRGSIIAVLPVGSKDMISGKNLFYFKMDDKGLRPYGLKEEDINSTSSFERGCDPAYVNVASGQGCAAWVIYNKNLDYLHCREELSWDGKHSCDD